MPIASRAEGRVNAGGDTSTTWAPDGLRRTTKPVNRNCDSYLQRYQEQMKKNRIVSQGSRDSAEVTHQGKEGTSEEAPGVYTSSEDAVSEQTSSGKKHRKSMLCVLL